MATIELSGGARVAGIGACVPEYSFTNQQLIDELGLDSSDEWIQQRIGVKKRHLVEHPKNISTSEKRMTTADMAVKAARMALCDADRKPNDVDGVIVATITGDYWLPSTACIVASKLGLDNVPAFDINAGCTGFIYNLILAQSLIESGKNKSILVIGTETLSTIVNWQDRDTAFLFADAAGALLLERSNGSATRMISDWGSNGDDPSILWTPAGGSKNPLTIDRMLANLHTIHMKGEQLLQIAIRSMVRSSTTTMEKAEITADQLALVVPHQANSRIIEGTRTRLKLSEEQIFVNVGDYANTSSASIPLALAEADQKGTLKRDAKILLTGFGSGLTWGSIYLIWKEEGRR